MNTYLIQLRGLVNIAELNPLSPHHMTAIRIEEKTTQCAISTDQAGMIGLLRHLHNLGFVLLAVVSQPGEGRQMAAATPLLERIEE